MPGASPATLAKARAARRYVRTPSVVLFFSHVQQSEDGCWEWTGTVDRRGYGVFGVYDSETSKKQRQVLAHRFSFEHHKRPLKPDEVVCHRCDNKKCVRPEHLFAGSQADNQHDKREKGRARNQNTGKTHCIRGHEFTPQNTLSNSRGGRKCRTCDHLRKSGKLTPIIRRREPTAMGSRSLRKAIAEVTR